MAVDGFYNHLGPLKTDYTFGVKPVYCNAIFWSAMPSRRELESELWCSSLLYIMSNIYRQEKWDYFRYYLAYGYSGIYWAGLEIHKKNLQRGH